MALTPRQKEILAEIVKLHILSGEPIGSKVLCEQMANAPSSATLRNEMSLLCDLGLLAQPHTSAGRIPTDLGYKLYIDTLMDKGTLSEDIKNYIDNAINRESCDPEKLPATAGRVLNEITGLPAISVDISPNGPVLRRVELITLSERLAMTVIITADGRSRSRLCHLSSPLTGEVVHLFEKIVSERLIKRSTSELNSAYMQNALAQAGLYAFSIMPLFSAISTMVKEIENSSVCISGQTAIFDMAKQTDAADKIMTLLGSRDTLVSLLSTTQSDFGVLFGGQTQFSILKPSSIIFAKYGNLDSVSGCLGVIGPTRISYEHIIPSVEYTAKRVNQVLSDALSEMEE